MKSFLFFIILIFVELAEASGQFNLIQVNVVCPESTSCNERRVRFTNLVGEYRSIVHLRDTLRVMASDGGYQSFSYAVYKIGKEYNLTINFKLKPIIREVNIGFLDRNFESDPSQLVTLREGESFEEQKVHNSMEAIKSRLEAMGFPNNKVSHTIIEKSDGIYITTAVTLGEPRIFKSIKTNSNSKFVGEFLHKKFFNLYNKPFEFSRFKLYLDDAQRELFTYGYYLINLDFNPVTKGNRVVLDIKVQNERLFAFDFRNLKEEEREVLQELVTGMFRKYKRPVSEATLKQAITEHYATRAFLNIEVGIEVSKFKNRFLETVQLYRIHIEEKYKTRVTSVNFLGNSYYSQKKLKEMFEKEAFELASIDYYDEEYLGFFSNYLKSRYIKNGFVQVKVLGPSKSFDPEKKEAVIEYSINEGQRAYIRSIKYEGMPQELEEKITSQMVNQQGKPFNPLALVEDIKSVSLTLQEHGYFYAEVTNANDDALVKYSRTGSDVDIRLKINSGPVVRLNRVLFLGNNKTRKRVLYKKITLEEGDLITPSKTREIEAAISAMGLFNTVQVSPIRHNSKNAATDLIIKVTEREYGLIEVAPGYRTDLGLKLTGTVSYLNIGGMNRALTLRGQVNQRFSYQSFDPRRRKEKHSVLEYNTSVTFTQGDVFDSLVDYSLGISNQRRRFYSFDADIQRINNTFTRDLSKKLSASIRHQLEEISQSDATEARDNGSFRIGAMTPSLTYDLRNSQINPVQGAFFNLSCEFANPYFGSQREQDLTINYYKLISRNRFYIPFKNGTVAISVVGGVQENLAKDLVTENGVPVINENGAKQTEGYIPNIKVFRLTGTDNVRGFSDEEINRLNNKEDISEARVQDKAYLANFKLEPRYFINDVLMGGVFLDAGRVFVDGMDLGDLRTSAGLTFKIITPVGTLDFDYGIKLLRKKDSSGNLEDPGRFHVSIGFF